MQQDLTFSQCEKRAQQMIERVKDVLDTRIDVLMNEQGNITVTVYDPAQQAAIVDMFINFWALKHLSRHGDAPVLMFFEFKEKTQ